MSTINAEDLIQPLGELEPDLFDGADDEDPTTVTMNRVQAYYEKAVELTASIGDDDREDEAIAAYVYWRALSAFVRQIRLVPADASIGDEKRTYSKEQLAALEADALGYKATFDQLTEDATPSRATTVAVTNQIIF